MIYEDPLSVEELHELRRLRELLGSGEAQRIRERLGFTAGQAAGCCGVATSTVTCWESGLKKPRTRKALCYLELLETARTPAETSGPGWPD